MRKKYLLLTTLVLPALLWLAAGRQIVALLAGKFGEALMRVGDGKFTDPAAFVSGRIKEAVLIFYAFIAIVAAGLFIRRLFERFFPRLGARGIRDGLLLFIGLNVLAAACGKTVLFWSMFYDKVNIDSFAQFHIKRELFKESMGPRRAVLLGNSQTNRCIDEKILNSKLGGSLWATDFTQPGARGFDLLILKRDIPLRPGDWVISYFSEVMFYGVGSGIIPPKFLHFGDLDDLVELGGWNKLSPGSVKSGIAGRIIPLYRYRESISQRVLRGEITGIGQFRHDTSLVPDLEQLAADSASSLTVGSHSTFEKQAVMRMADEVAALGCKLIIIDGDVHPALEKHMSQSVRDDMKSFLSELKSRHPDTVVITDAGLYLQPTEDAYDDLVHFTDAAQAEFSENLAAFLEEMNPAAKDVR